MLYTHAIDTAGAGNPIYATLS